MTTKASARQPTPPSRNASGVEPPATAATPDTLSSMAMPGASTDTEMAMASQSRSEPWASSPLAAPVIRSGLVFPAMTASLLLRHQDTDRVQVVVEGQRRAVAGRQPVQELHVHRVRLVGVQRGHVGKLGVEQVRVAAGP